MAVFRVDPMAGIDAIAKRVNTIAKEIEKGVVFETGAFNPRANIFESIEKFDIQIELPGIPKESINLMVTDDHTLEITGEKTKPSNDLKIIRGERSFGKFKREFILPENVDAGSISARYDLGVLHVTISKKSPVKREIKIEVQ